MGESKRRRQHQLQFPNEPIVSKPIPAWKLIEDGKRAAAKAATLDQRVPKD